MTANINDHFTKTFTTDMPASTTVSSVRAANGTTLVCNLINWPSDTAVHYATYKKDPANPKKPKDGTVKFYKGIVAGNTITQVTPKFTGTDPGNDVNDVVEMGPSGTWADDLIEGLLVAHAQDGSVTASGVKQYGSGDNLVFKVSSSQPAAVTGKKVIWFKPV